MEKSHNKNVSSAFSLADGPIKLTDALARCDELLADRAESIIRLIIQTKDKKYCI